jgi:hypothetical protein
MNRPLSPPAISQIRPTGKLNAKIQPPSSIDTITVQVSPATAPVSRRRIARTTSALPHSRRCTMGRMRAHTMARGMLQIVIADKSPDPNQLFHATYRLARPTDSRTPSGAEVQV